jgi:proteasome lid subunit RPN8/RPN11
MRALHLPDELAAEILQAAARTYPNEACGLIEGTDGADGWHALAVHESLNLAKDPTRHFLIDPELQFALLKKLRGGERRIIGCFHSHPDGSAKPSATDRAEAYESGFIYVIAAGGDGVFSLKAYLYEESNGFSELPMAAGD